MQSFGDYLTQTELQKHNEGFNGFSTKKDSVTKDSNAGEKKSQKLLENFYFQCHYWIRRMILGGPLYLNFKFA